MKRFTRRPFVISFVAFAALLTFVTIVAAVAGDAYVRWTLNQNFSFLSGFTLPALIALFLGLMVTLAHYADRS